MLFQTCLVYSFICDKKEKEMPGSLMKALMRPGGGDSRPSDGDQVTLLFIYLFLSSRS